MARITGILKDGMGNPIINCRIILRAIHTSTAVLVHAEASQRPGDAGQYDMHVEPGAYSVLIWVDNHQPEQVGNIQVYPDSQDGTLNYFLGLPQEVDLRPEVMKAFEGMVQQVSLHATEIEKSKNAAQQSAQDAQHSLTAAQEAKDEAVSAAGGAADTAAAQAASKVVQEVKTQIQEEVKADKASAEGSAATAQALAKQAGDAEHAASESARAAQSLAQAAAGSASSAHSSAQASEASAQAASRSLASVTAAAGAAAGSASSAQQADANATSQAQAAERSAQAAKSSENAASGYRDEAQDAAQRAKQEADNINGQLERKQDASSLLSHIAALSPSGSSLLGFAGEQDVEAVALSIFAKTILGADNAQEILDHLDMSDTKTLADNSLQKGENGQDIADKAAFRSAIDAYPVSKVSDLGNGERFDSRTTPGLHRVAVSQQSTVADFPKQGDSYLYGWGFLLVFGENESNFVQVYLAHAGQLAFRVKYDGGMKPWSVVSVSVQS
ncbi:prophage tail fiber N-terminal domain-containing protein [Edwardsiella tarda]|uniref:prophage tail fiber N-terminal domain-containing protein n=1 Tax=Edwardsiella tarda TaxID=636 RepID=UPI0024443A67|nr:prophage tail fiber N-terminal domain-containing protein [Edwardsiella tarda]WGE30539.1 prophage tail fiber N-terminal domain-containing protein [Edwardsiella tarda]